MKARSALSLSNEWSTPPALFAYLDALYGPFDTDVAAAPWNAKCPRFFTRRDNGLRQQWGTRNWCNSPYSTGQKEAFLNRGRLFVEQGKSLLSCHLLPADTSDGYWTRHVRASAGTLLGVTAHASALGWVTQTRWQCLTVEVTEIRGRLQYRHRTGATGTARHSSAVVTLARPGVLPLLQWGDARSQFPFESKRLDRRAA